MFVEAKVIGNDTKLGAVLNRHFLGERSHYIEVGPEKIVLPGKFEGFLERIKNFKVYDDDIYIFAFPKSGSRWVQELLWLIQNELDFETAKSVMMCRRSPLLELEILFDEPQHQYALFELVENLKRPRCIRSHLHWSLLPDSITNGTKQPKIIVMMRNPEDTCTSYYYQSAIVEGYNGSWDDFCELFLEGKVPYGPYWNHVLGYWKERDRLNIMFINYNKMKNNLPSVVREVTTFLGKTLTENNLKKLCDYLSFDNLKNCKSFNMEEVVKSKNDKMNINPFVRSGKIGDHKNMMSDDITQVFRFQKKLFLEGTGLNLI
ncbi:hypothetical protein FQR65_LT02067 [Abscondita terminalis]|nr:hypothetical protein FQR65_LT02067 [Abscondita terminalis]